MEFQMQTPETMKIMNELFSDDCHIVLATSDNNIPSVYNVDSYYENGAFYIITNTLSDEFKQIEKNHVVALSGKGLTAHAITVNMGYFCSDENKIISQKLREVFSDCTDSDENDFCYGNTCIICIRLKHGKLISGNKIFNINFLMK